MKNNKLNLLMITSLLIPFNVLAMNKTETIYENLNSNGERTNIVVSNHLSDIGDKNTISDNTILKDILNINGDEEYKLDGNNLTWNNNGKDIYYQGSTDEESPITVKVSYKLNDEDIDIKDLIGKSGNIKIKLDFENNSYDVVDLGNTNERIYTPFVTTIGTIISNGSNVEINNGKSVSTGNRTIVVGIATPYLDKSLDISDLSDYNSIEISYDTDSFDLNDIYIVSTPKLFEDSDLSIFDKLDSAVDGINELSSGVSKLKAGANSLANGANSLVSGANELSDGINSAYEGSNKLTNGSSSLTNGLKSALDGANSLSKGSKDVDDSLKQIIAGLKQSISDLNNKENELNNKLSEVKNLENTNKTTINSLSAENNQIQSLVNQKITNISIDLSKQEEDILRTLDENGMSSLKDEITSYKKMYDNNKNLITLLSSNEGTLEILTSNLNTSLKAISTNLNNLNTYLDKLETTGTSQILSGSTELVNGLNILYKGSINLENGINSLNDGLNSANTGASSLASGANSLASGANELSDGIETLDTNGISKLRELSSKINTYEDKAKAIINSSKNYNGFASDNSNDTTLVSVIKNN